MHVDKTVISQPVAICCTQLCHLACLALGRVLHGMPLDVCLTPYLQMAPLTNVLQYMLPTFA